MSIDTEKQKGNKPDRWLPATLPIRTAVAVRDTREQLPFILPGLQVIDGTLDAGDYSIFGLENRIALERKSLSDLVSCCGSERERFERELQRLKAYEARAVFVEASWSEVERGNWRSAIKPESVTGSVLAWMADIPFFFAGSRDAADKAAARFLYTAAKRRYREIRTLLMPDGRELPEVVE